jgi:hypothetical protein
MHAFPRISISHAISAGTQRLEFKAACLEHRPLLLADAMALAARVCLAGALGFFAATQAAQADVHHADAHHAPRHSRAGGEGHAGYRFADADAEVSLARFAGDRHVATTSPIPPPPALPVAQRVAQPSPAAKPAPGSKPGKTPAGGAQNATKAANGTATAAWWLPPATMSSAAAAAGIGATMPPGFPPGWHAPPAVGIYHNSVYSPMYGAYAGYSPYLASIAMARQAYGLPGGYSPGGGSPVPPAYPYAGGNPFTSTAAGPWPGGAPYYGGHYPIHPSAAVTGLPSGYSNV